MPARLPRCTNLFGDMDEYVVAVVGINCCAHVLLKTHPALAVTTWHVTKSQVEISAACVASWQRMKCAHARGNTCLLQLAALRLRLQPSPPPASAPALLTMGCVLVCRLLRCAAFVLELVLIVLHQIER